MLLLSIHDIAVLPRAPAPWHRSATLLEAIGTYAREVRCRTLALEVREDTPVARRTYERAGFQRSVYNEAAGGALFLAKRPVAVRGSGQVFNTTHNNEHYGNLVV